MEIYSAICAPGGDTAVRTEEWKSGPNDPAWYVVEPTTAVLKGMCIKPVDCKLRSVCSGKVRFSKSEDSGFSQGMIVNVVPEDLRKFEKIWVDG